jgi:hypothetical protein
MTLDPEVICISPVPIAGIAVMGAASVRQFILRDRELVGLAGFDDEFAAAALPDATRNRATEMTVMKPFTDNLEQAVKRFAELWSAGHPII